MAQQQQSKWDRFNMALAQEPYSNELANGDVSDNK